MGEWLSLPGANSCVRRDQVVRVSLTTDTAPATDVHYVKIRVDGVDVNWFSSTDLTAAQNEFNRFLAEEV